MLYWNNFPYITHGKFNADIFPKNKTSIIGPLRMQLEKIATQWACIKISKQKFLLRVLRYYDNDNDNDNDFI